MDRATGPQSRVRSSSTGDPACVRRWMGASGHLFCQRGEVREIMRPVIVPTPDGSARWGLCDGIHRDDHEFVPA